MKNTNWVQLALALCCVFFVDTAMAARVFCIEKRFDYWDANQGEDYLTQGASYGVERTARHFARIKRDGTTIWDGYLGSTGCTPTLSGAQMSAGEYVVYVTSKVALGGVATAVVRPDKTYEDNGITQWTLWNLGALTASTAAAPVNNHLVTSVSLSNPSLSVSMALTVPAMHTSTNAPYVASDVYRLFADDDECGALVSCFRDGEDAVFFGESPTLGKDAFSKSVVGHEIGHYFADHLLGEPVFDGYGASAPAGPCPGTDTNCLLCKCDHVPVADGQSHCLQSREFSSAAMAEGWGHFVAATMYNIPSQSDAWFGYYKAFRTGGGVTNPPLGWSVLTESRWHEMYCNPTSNRGVEADWLGFFYKVHHKTANLYTFPEIKDIFFQDCNGLCTNNDVLTWSTLNSAAALMFAGAKAEFWEDTNIDFGTDH